MLSTDRQAESSTYSYTPSGKIDTIRYHDNSTVRFSYNQHDRMTSMSDDLGTTSYIHDAAGRLISVTDPNGNTVGYVYDENGFTGLLTSLIYPGNKRVQYGYDQLNRLSTITDWQGRIASYDYDAAGRLTQLVNFNGTVTKYFYDNADRLTGIDSRTAANAVIASFAYTLDANGNRVEVEKQSPLQPLLPAISESSQHQQDRLSTRRNIQYTYDHEGQLATSKEGSAAAQVFSFNKAYRLTGISGGTTYSYDGSGNRLRAVRNGVETRYIYDAAGNLLAETDTAGAVSRYYIHGLGLLAAVTPADAVSCYHYDGVGSTVAITNSSQTVVNAYAYDPFGNILSQNEAFAQPFKYVGKLGVMAEPNGFYSMRARYYDPAAGRFISEDPLGFDGGDVNLYVYAGNNPVNRVDPSGLYWFRQDWQTEFVVGRDGSSLVWPGSPIGRVIENYVPAGRTFGDLHDSFVGAATNAGLPDLLVNIPSMIPVYGAAIATEVLRTVGILDQPVPPTQQTTMTITQPSTRK